MENIRKEVILQNYELILNKLKASLLPVCPTYLPNDISTNWFSN